VPDSDAMTTPRLFHTATLLPTHQVLLTGGFAEFTLSGFPSQNSAETWSYGAVGLLHELQQTVVRFNLQQGIENSLDAKLDAVSNVLDDINENNDIAGVNALYAFISAVEAQRGNKITDEQADQLIGAAEAIILQLSGV